ncbi:hypothetical protein O0235_09420 [Tepidiforma flava]|uniref:Flagellar basal-body/hook protein C-terminal domain-containing protein n=1 Tax=Tepidiforma flava TaxID=3004094 RepID=A0ABY7M5F6_9CHLR|nr:flagellar basal body rod C-terminal domain-containing protein [Tepidiforma flava]WBL35006.1 hypothetical protein O0235_09420 [Tepidiforma flava]
MNGSNVVATLHVAVTGSYSAAQQVADLTAPGNDTIRVDASPPALLLRQPGRRPRRRRQPCARHGAVRQGLLVDHLDTMRQATHGVNIDEEVTNLQAAQHAYNAAARVITVIDDMLDTLINRTGVTR